MMRNASPTAKWFRGFFGEQRFCERMFGKGLFGKGLFGKGLFGGRLQGGQLFGQRHSAVSCNAAFGGGLFGERRSAVRFGEGRFEKSKRPDELGSGTVLAAAAICIGCLLAVVLVVTGAYLTRVQQVRQTVDLIAISAAVHGCKNATAIADSSQVLLSDCEVAGDVFDYVVTATVETQFSFLGFATNISETAYAGRLAQ